MKKLSFLKRASMEARILPIIALFILIVGIPYVISAHSVYTTEYIFMIVLGFFMIIIRAIAIINIRNKYVDMVLTILIIIITLITLLVFGSLALVIVLIYPKLVYRVIYVLALVILFVLGIHLKFEGPEPKKGEQFITMANHTSFIDELLIIISMKIKSWTIIYAEEIKRVPFFGKILKKYGISVNRNSIISRGKAAIKAEKEISLGKNLAIYPEGKRLDPSDFEKGVVLYPFHKGVISIACNSGLPIYPVVLLFPFFYKPRVGKWWVSPMEVIVVRLPKVETKYRNPDTVAEEVFVIMECVLRERIK